MSNTKYLTATEVTEKIVAALAMVRTGVVGGTVIKFTDDIQMAVKASWDGKGKGKVKEHDGLTFNGQHALELLLGHCYAPHAFQQINTVFKLRSWTVVALGRGILRLSNGANQLELTFDPEALVALKKIRIPVNTYDHFVVMPRADYLGELELIRKWNTVIDEALSAEKAARIKALESIESEMASWHRKIKENPDKTYYVQVRSVGPIIERSRLYVTEGDAEDDGKSTQGFYNIYLVPVVAKAVSARKLELRAPDIGVLVGVQTTVGRPALTEFILPTSRLRELDELLEEAKQNPALRHYCVAPVVGEDIFSEMRAIEKEGGWGWTR